MRYKCDSVPKKTKKRNEPTLPFIYSRIGCFGLSVTRGVAELSGDMQGCHQTESCTHTAGCRSAARNTVAGSDRAKAAGSGSGCNNYTWAPGTLDTPVVAGILARLRPACYFAPRVRWGECSA